MQVTFLETGLDNRHKRRVLWLLVLIAFALALWRTENWNREAALTNLQESSRQELRRYVLHLQGQLEKYEFLPGVLASNKPLVYLLQHPGDQERIVALNNYLETVNKLTGTSDTYLMDANGLTIAAIN